MNVLMIKGVWDRTEEERYAVILVDELGKEFTLSTNELPEGSKPGTWYDVQIANNEITKLTINKLNTMNTEEEIMNKVTKLKAKSRESRFRRK